MARTQRYKVFISYHHDDQEYKDRFGQMMKEYIADKSVGDGDIGDRNIKTAAVRQKIQNDCIAGATVSIVLIGPRTWQRKYVDWEISFSLRKTKKKSRCGLLGILLPNHPDFKKEPASRNPRLIPPRLAANCEGDDPYARIYRWSGSPNEVNRVRQWIHQACSRRNGPPPNNGQQQFSDNRTSPSSAGWQN